MKHTILAMAFLLTASHSVCRGALSEQRLSVTIQKKVALGYLLFLPDDYGAATNRAWPLLLFLHGSGERGRDLSKLTMLWSAQAGCGDTSMVASVRHMPVWVFHGTDDRVVPIKKSEEMVTALQQAGGTVRFTRYEKTGHNAWTKAYDDPALYPWLLQQHN